MTCAALKEAEAHPPTLLGARQWLSQLQPTSLMFVLMRPRTRMVLSSHMFVAECCQVDATRSVNERLLHAGLGDMLVQVLTCAGRASLPSPCTELTPWGTLSLLQVSQNLPHGKCACSKCSTLP